MNVLHGTKIKADKNEILEILRTNRETHKKIVIEARDGYIKKAERMLELRLGQLKEGKLIEVHVGLRVPKDYTKVYDTAIRMLELDQGDTIELNSQQVQHLVMDDWDWMEDFLFTNSEYSSTAAEFVGSKF